MGQGPCPPCPLETLCAASQPALGSPVAQGRWFRPRDGCPCWELCPEVSTALADPAPTANGPEPQLSDTRVAPTSMAPPSPLLPSRTAQGSRFPPGSVPAPSPLPSGPLWLCSAHLLPLVTPLPPHLSPSAATHPAWDTPHPELPENCRLAY